MSNRHPSSLAVSQSDAPARSPVRLRNRKRTSDGLRQLTPVDLGLPLFTCQAIFQNEPNEPSDRTELDKTGQNPTARQECENEPTTSVCSFCPSTDPQVRSSPRHLRNLETERLM
jgi:hypothetical protein